jgi:hypothetical protein
LKKVGLLLIFILFASAQSLTPKMQTEAENIATDVSKEYIAYLKQHMKKVLLSKGAVAAIKFCNENAYPLTMKFAFKLSREYHLRLKLKRISFKNRDVADYPNQNDAKFVKELSKEKSDIHPIIKTYPDRIDVYEPIYIQKVCLNCHGKHLKPKVIRILHKLYPKDKATGYSQGDFRGAVVVSIDKKSFMNYMKNIQKKN